MSSGDHRKPEEAHLSYNMKMKTRGFRDKPQGRNVFGRFEGLKAAAE